MRVGHRSCPLRAGRRAWDRRHFMLPFHLEPIARGPLLLLFGMVAYVVAVAGATLAGLRAGLLRAGFEEARQLRIARRTGALLAAWFLLLAMSTVSGLYLDA